MESKIDFNEPQQSIYNPSVSIVIPTFNSSKTLPLCLESVAAQDYPKDKIEIIIADGGSTDSTLEIAREYTNKIYPNPLKTGGDYLFDIDIVYELIMQRKNEFAKVKVGIVHLFSGDVFTFIKKQRRRIKDYAYYKEQKLRKYPWGEAGQGMVALCNHFNRTI